MKPLQYDKMGEKECGFLAQDVLNIPELIFSVKSGGNVINLHNNDHDDNESEKSSNYSLDYGSIFTYNIAATQELDSKVTVIEEDIDINKKLLLDTQNQLQDTQNQLQDTQDELQHTKNELKNTMLKLNNLYSQFESLKSVILA